MYWPVWENEWLCLVNSIAVLLHFLPFIWFGRCVPLQLYSFHSLMADGDTLFK